MGLVGLLRHLMREANEDDNLRRCLTRLLLEELGSMFPGLGWLVRLRLSVSGVPPEEVEPEVVLEQLSKYGIDPGVLLARLGASSVGELLEKHRGKIKRLCGKRGLV